LCIDAGFQNGHGCIIFFSGTLLVLKMTSVKFRLAQLYEPCDCHKRNKHEMHYISFDETFQRLREVTDDVLEHLGSRRDVLKFVLGQTYVLPKEGKAFDFKKHKTWSKKGIREQWDFLTDKGFNDIVVIGCVEDDLIRNDACVQLRDPEKYAYALKQRLIMHYAYQKHDERLACDSLQPELTTGEKTEGRLIYIAFKFKEDDKRKKKYE
jgi:hypothetical protein